MCSTCPAVFHAACYSRCTGQTVGDVESWQCASCAAAAECAAAGCGWCEQHGADDTRVDVHAAWEEHKQTLEIGVAAVGVVAALPGVAAGIAAVPLPREAAPAQPQTQAPTTGSAAEGPAPVVATPAEDPPGEAVMAQQTAPVADTAPDREVATAHPVVGQLNTVSRSTTNAATEAVMTIADVTAVLKKANELLGAVRQVWRSF